MVPSYRSKPTPSVPTPDDLLRVELGLEAVKTQPIDPAIDQPTDAQTAVPLGHILRLARVVGYGLLILSFVDFLYVLFPVDFMDPVWEYQFAGDLVKLVPVPILAVVLVFSGDAIDRQDLEWPVLKVLSWLTLVFSIVLFLLMPLTAANTLRINRFNNEQISTQVNQQQQQIESTRSQFEQATPAQLQSLVPTPNEQGQLPNAPTSPEDARAQILDNLSQAKAQAAAQAQQARDNVKQNLIKNTFKLIAESALGCLLFLYAWLVTGWARRGRGAIQTTSGAPPQNPATSFGRRLGRWFGRKPKRMKHRIR